MNNPNDIGLKENEERQPIPPKKWLFFYEGEEDGWTFTVEADSYEEAYDKAYEEWGPQVQGMYYKQI